MGDFNQDTSAVRWNAKANRLEQSFNHGRGTSWQAFTSQPDISGIKVIKEGLRRRLHITDIARRGRAAAAVPENRRTVNQRMDIAIWNLTWRCLKTHRPELAKLLKDDFVIRALDIFDGSISVDLNMFID